MLAIGRDYADVAPIDGVIYASGGQRLKVGVSVTPIIPFINEPEIERILEAAAAAGASSAFGIVLRLPWEVNPIFQRWLDNGPDDPPVEEEVRASLAR